MCTLPKFSTLVHLNLATAVDTRSVGSIVGKYSTHTATLPPLSVLSENKYLRILLWGNNDLRILLSALNLVNVRVS